MNDALRIRLNPSPAIERIPIDGDHFAIVADDFLANPEEVVEYASAHREDFEAPERSYPGEVLDLPANAGEDLHRIWRGPLSREFSFARTDLKDSCQVSLTTLQPENFSWIQRLPHQDPQTEPGRRNIALLVYLFDRPELGGTGFYRYRDRKFWESMARRQVEDPDGGLSIVQTRYPMFLEPPCYVTGSNEAVELLGAVEAKFNRMVCYSGDIPHSAQISDASLLSEDCKRGRLTLNAFASVWPKRG